MKKLAPILFAFCLFAADPWQSKPFTEWSEKDINKILTNSPWSRVVSVELRGSLASPTDRLGRERMGDPTGNRPATMGPTTGPGVMVPSPNPGDANRPGGAADNTGQLGGEGHSLVLTVRWQSALAVKQALMRRKYGAEAATSPDAKKVLDENSVYMLAVSGLPPAAAPELKAAILSETGLSAKGKDLRPSDVLLPPPGKIGETFFIFQKTTPFTLDDKDVEFVTKLAGHDIRCKFRLKDMLLQGDLAL